MAAAAAAEAASVCGAMASAGARAVVTPLGDASLSNHPLRVGRGISRGNDAAAPAAPRGAQQYFLDNLCVGEGGARATGAWRGALPPARRVPGVLLGGHSSPIDPVDVNMSKRLSGLVPGRRRNDGSSDQQAEEDVDWSLPIGASAVPAIAPAAAPKYGIGGSSHYLGLSPRWG